MKSDTPTSREAIDHQQRMNLILDDFRHGVVVDATGGMIKGDPNEVAIKKSDRYQAQALDALMEVMVEGQIDELEKLTRMNTTIHTPVGGISTIRWVEMSKIERHLSDLRAKLSAHKGMENTDA